MQADTEQDVGAQEGQPGIQQPLPAVPVKTAPFKGGQGLFVAAGSNQHSSPHAFGTDTPPAQLEQLLIYRSSSTSSCGSATDPARHVQLLTVPAAAKPPQHPQHFQHHQHQGNSHAFDDGEPGLLGDQAARHNPAQQHTNLASSKSELLALMLRNFRHQWPAPGPQQHVQQSDSVQLAALQDECADTLHDSYSFSSSHAAPVAVHERHPTQPAGWTSDLPPAPAEEFSPWEAADNLTRQDDAEAMQLSQPCMRQQPQPQQEPPSVVAGVAAMFLDSLTAAFTNSSVHDSQHKRLSALDRTVYSTGNGPLSAAALQAYEQLKTMAKSQLSTGVQSGQLLAEVFPHVGDTAPSASESMGASHPLSTGVDAFDSPHGFGSPHGSLNGSPFGSPFLGCGSDYSNGLMSAHSRGSLTSGNSEGAEQPQPHEAPFGYGQQDQVAFGYMTGSARGSLGQHSASSPLPRRNRAPAGASPASLRSPARGQASKLGAAAGRTSNVHKTPVKEAVHCGTTSEPKSPCVFSPTERWMRELRETVDAATQQRIRQDWLAKAEPRELPVLCKGVEATFFVDANTKRCKIRTLDGRVISPNEFEAECGAGNSKAWLQSIVARDYKSVSINCDGFPTSRSICLGHFTRLVNIDTSRKPQCAQQGGVM